jgi:hypothetical protein
VNNVSGGLEFFVEFFLGNRASVRFNEHRHGILGKSGAGAPPFTDMQHRRRQETPEQTEPLR